jgi:uncharacterized membrane protein
LIAAHGPVRSFLWPLHSLLLAFPVALFSCAVLADITYLNTAVLQWSHFAAWLVLGGLVFGTPVLAWALWGAVRTRKAPAARAGLLYLGLLAVMWLAALVNSFQHGRDAWSSVGSLGVVLSIVSAVAAIGAGWIAWSRVGAREMTP